MRFWVRRVLLRSWIKQKRLTEGTDDSITPEPTGGCCGFAFPSSRPQLRASSSTSGTLQISYYNVLWAEIVNGRISIQYLKEQARKNGKVVTVSYALDKPVQPSIQAWIERLLDKAYGESQRQKRIKVLINPHGGQGKAQKHYFRDIAPIFTAARCELDVQKTQHGGHAIDIAQELDIEKWDVVACCSGDGTPHEIFNGLAKQARPRRALAKIAVVQLPCGSGNAMSMNLSGTDDPSLSALAVVKGIRTPIDLASVTFGNERLLSFLSQSLGIVAESDLATENMRFLGAKRFDVGFALRAVRRTQWPVDLAIGVEMENKSEIRDSYRQQSDGGEPLKAAYNVDDEATDLPSLRFGSIVDQLPESWNMQPFPNLGNLYCGNMAYMSGDANFFPAALPADGCMDLITIRGDISAMKSFALAESIKKAKFFDHPLVRYRKITGFRVIPKQSEGYISIDGERIPFGPFQVEVHPGLGCVLSKSGRMYEARGP